MWVLGGEGEAGKGAYCDATTRVDEGLRGGHRSIAGLDVVLGVDQRGAVIPAAQQEEGVGGGARRLGQALAGTGATHLDMTSLKRL